MAEITNRGRHLAQKLGPVLGWTRDLAATCSLIARHAVTHHRLAEAECNGDAPQEWIERRTALIERRIRDLVGSLPRTDEGPIGVRFGGDPRGYTVKLVLPGSLAQYHDDWGREGIGCAD